MASVPASSQNRSAQIRRGPIGRLMIGILGFAFWIVMGLVGNIAFECVCVGWLWPQEGPKRSQAMLEAELTYLQDDFKGSLVVDQPANFATQLAASLRERLYQRTGIEAALSKVDAVSRKAEEGSFKKQVRQMTAGTRIYVQAAIIATEVYAVRIAVLILSLPIFIVLGLTGLVEGMTERDLRRFSGGRERGQIYHLAKRGIAPSLTMPWVIYLAWPTTVHPNFIIVPSAFLFSAALYVSASSFKKYW